MESKALEGIKIIDQLELSGKRLFLRLDLNVPLQDGRITDDTRIRAAIPTIQYAREQGAKIVIASHLGRPQGFADRAKLSLEPIAEHIKTLLDVEVILVEEPRSNTPKALLAGLKRNQLIVLENLRFDPGEEANDLEYAQVIADYTDVYVDDAFGACHRAHMSIARLPEIVSLHGVGFLIQRELNMLDRVRFHHDSPFIAILGGAKVSDKIKVIENMVDSVDAFMIGGAMAYTFLAASGIEVGNSRVEKDKIKFAGDLMARIEARKKRLYLPVDHIVAEDFDSLNGLRTTAGSAIDKGWMGLDIGPQTLRQYSALLTKAKTIFWNGPMGVFERSELSKGTFGIAKALSECTGVTVVGGGDSAAAAEASGYGSAMTHISTGGGASLEYLEGRKMPGLEALRPPKRSEVRGVDPL
jgi:phosphoglycerate kinase